jgi:hypothetical protein
MARREEIRRPVHEAQQEHPERPDQVDGPVELPSDGNRFEGQEPTAQPDIISAESAHPFGLDLNDVPEKIKKAFLNLLERVDILEAKTHFMPIARPMQAPDGKNHNTDSIKVL